MGMNRQVVKRRRRSQRGVTLIETMVALVVTLLVAVPALGFVALAGARQAQALAVNTETGQVIVGTSFCAMTGSKAAVSQLNSDNWRI
jgi:prepilin-type N-terminal cleavage/methylation domain-containing protein